MSQKPVEPSRRPSARLLGAALSGLLGAAGCGDDDAAEPDPVQPDAAEQVVDASVPDAPSAPDAAPSIDAAPPDAGSKIISETEGTRTFAELTAACDTRGGYTQIHPSCSGVNMCAGFSYGDWDPGVTIEHSCSGVNGCNGISCVVLPADTGKTGKEVYEAALGEDGPRTCLNCHAIWDENGPDATKFKLYLLPGSPRSVDSWLDMPALYQEKTVAFGRSGVLPDGSSYSSMAAYHKLWSRAEIARAVQHIRGLTVVAAEIKLGDPP